MVTFKDLEIDVRVDSVPLTEYDDDDDDDVEEGNSESPTITKYIEAKAGKAFAIHYKVERDFKFGGAEYVVLHMLLDGQRVSGANVHKNDVSPRYGFKGSRATHTYQDGHQWKEMDYLFSDISFQKVQDDVQVRDIKEKYRFLGSIEIVVWRTILLKDNVTSHNTAVELNSQPIPEKAIKGKAISLSCKLGKPKPAEKRDVVHGIKYDPSPIAKFIFKYRSKKDLQALRIIPRTPSPEPLENRPPEQLTHEEALEVIRIQRAQMAAASRIKKETRRIKEESGNRHMPQQLKREYRDSSAIDEDLVILSDGPEPKRRRVESEVIDLT